METDVFDVADEVLSHDLLRIHLFFIDGYWIISDANNSKQKDCYDAVIVFGICLCIYLI